FGNDSIALADDRISVNGGARLEWASGLGWGLHPMARVMWNVTPDRHRLWAAVSRAIRTPALQDRGIQLTYPPLPGPGGLPVMVTLNGNPDLRPEDVISTDAGYRLVLPRAQLEVDGFRSEYHRLRTSEPQAPHLDVTSGAPVVLQPIVFDNLFDARTTGVEATARWQPAACWRL